MGNPEGGFRTNVSYGAIFIDNFGNFLVFGNTRGHLYQINIESDLVNRVSTTSITSSNIDGANCIMSSVALPFSLLKFEATKLKEFSARLEWIVTEENSMVNFEVERINNGNDWEKIGTVSYSDVVSKEIGTLTYAFINENAL